MNHLDFQTLKEFLPEYKVIDISVVNDIDQYFNLTSKAETDDDLVIVLFRSAGNKALWARLDQCHAALGNYTGLTSNQKPDVMLAHKALDLGMCLDKGKEHTLKSIRLWLESQSTTNCYICDELIQNLGITCPTCMKAPCLNCSHKMMKLGNIDCSLCRSKTSE